MFYMMAKICKSTVNDPEMNDLITMMSTNERKDVFMHSLLLDPY